MQASQSASLGVRVPRHWPRLVGSAFRANWYRKRWASPGVGWRKHIDRLRAETPGAQEGQNTDAAKMHQLLEEKMKDPAVQQRMQAMQEAMEKPEVQQQMQQAMSYMQSEELQQKVEALKEDEELKPMFEELKKGGMQAFMKYFNDPEMMLKLGKKLGPPPEVATPPPGGTSQQVPEVEINNIVDAAKYGDLEAVEDFLAIGKDPNATDAERRTALHFAAATQHMDIMAALIGAQASLEARDSKENTPLHYAAGYGRIHAARRLLDAGANGGVKNDKGQTPADLARLNEANPVGQDESIMALLDEQASHAPVFLDQ